MSSGEVEQTYEDPPPEAVEDLVGDLTGVIEVPTEEECYLYSILTDESGIDLAEFAIYNPENDDGCFRAWPFQYSWFRDSHPQVIDQCGRAVGKTLSILLRAFAFVFNYPGAEMLVTAPELNHLEMVTEKIESYFFDTRLGSEMIERRRGSLTHRPFLMKFANGTKIIGRIPQRDGRGVKGQHPLILAQDESQDYPKAGWKELTHTLKRGVIGAQWRAHGVSRGVQDEFYDRTQNVPGNPWHVHRISQIHRPNWNDEERQQQISEAGGSREDPDYKRNVYGEHGGAVNMLFILHRLMKCQPGGTLVWTIQDEAKVSPIPIETVGVGDAVVTALGRGEVTEVHESSHRKLSRIRFDGGEHVCTPEHPLLTPNGWVRADQLRIGTRLVRFADMPGLLETAAREGTEILQQGLLEDGRDQAGQTVPSVWQAISWAMENVFKRVRQPRAQVSESTARRDVSVLWAAHYYGHVLSRVLFGGMRKGLKASTKDNVYLRRMWRRRVVGEAATVLLKDLRRESSGQDEDYEKELQGMRVLSHSFLSAQQSDAILFSAMLEPSVGSDKDRFARSFLSTLRQVFSSGPFNAALLRQGLLDCSKDQGAASKGEKPHECRQSRRHADPSVPIMASLGRRAQGMASAILDLTIRRTRRQLRLHSDRRGSSGPEDRSRGGRCQSSTGETGGRGQGARRLANFPRVDSVEILERGDQDFDRLSGGEDHVVCYDLTVSGHPSYAVGPMGLLVHNCVDSEPESDYNDNEYYPVTIKDIDLEERQCDVSDLLDLPASHTAKYKTFWAGMDVGYTNDPSEILVFAEYKPNAAERKLDAHFKRAHPIEGATRVKLITRISLIRVSNPQQVKAVLAVVRHYKPKCFALDKTGAGLPLFQDIQDLIETAASPEQEAEARSVAETIKGYNFSEKILVDIDETIDVPVPAAMDAADPTQVAKQAGIERSVLEHSTDCLRRMVDEGRIFFPWDRELIKELQGQTFSYSKANMDQYGRRRRQFSEGRFHALDACRMSAMGLVQHSIEEFIGSKKKQKPVLDSFMQP